MAAYEAEGGAFQALMASLDDDEKAIALATAVRADIEKRLREERPDDMQKWDLAGLILAGREAKRQKPKGRLRYGMTSPAADEDYSGYEEGLDAIYACLEKHGPILRNEACEFVVDGGWKAGVAPRASLIKRLQSSLTSHAGTASRRIGEKSLGRRKTMLYIIGVHEDPK